MKRKITFLLSALFALTLITQSFTAMGQTKDPLTATLTISTYASNHSWSSGTRYYEAVVSPVTFTASDGGTYNGTYNTSWRFYESDNGTITISVPTTYELSSVTFTYGNNNKGVIKDGETQVSSGAEYQISGTSKTFSIGHSSGSNKGRVDINSAVVAYTSVLTPTHTLSYSATNGTITGVDGGSAPVASGASVAEGAKVYLTATPSSASYAFKNWEVSSNGGTFYNVNSDTTAFYMGTTNATITAHFATPHNFAYTATNGSITVNKGRPVETNTPIAEGGVLSISATPTSGYKFKQWTVTGTGSTVASTTTNPTTFTMGTADASLEAEFEVCYTVTYDANGATSGTVPTDETQYSSNATVTVKTNSGTLAKTGYDFGGWNTKADGTGTNYTAGSGTFSITANTTLYAKWNPKTYTVAVSSVADATVSAAYASSTIAEGGSAPGIAYGTEITLRADGLGAGKGIAWDVYKTGDATTKVTVTDNKFTVPTYNVTVSGTVGNVFVKYTSDIAEGDYVLYNSAAMKNVVSSSRLSNQSDNIIVVGNEMIITNDATEEDVTWHIANISETSYWTLYNADESKYAAGVKNTKSQIQLIESVTDYAKWTVSVSEGLYDFVNYGRGNDDTDNDKKYLRRNGSNGWACYAATGTGTKTYLYKKSNTYRLNVESVDNITNTATPSGQSAIAEGANAYVKPGVTVALASSPSADYIIDEWDVYKTGSSSTKVTVTSNTFTMPDYAVTVSATTRAIAKVDVKYYVNGALIATVNVTEGEEMTLKTAGEIDVPDGYTFAGWTDDEDDLNTLYTGTYTPVGETNLYAVFTATKPATFSFTIDKDDFTTESYATNNGYTKNKIATTATGETFNVTCYSYQIQQNSGAMQWQKSAGYLYNSTDLGTILSVSVTSTAGTYTTYYGTSAQPSSGTAGTGKGYFKTSVGSDTGKTSSVVVVFTKSVVRKFTRVIDEDINISTTVALNAPAIIESGETMTIKNGGILNAGDNLTIIDGGKLVIEDGGQLITTTSVEATIEKNITSASSKTVDDHWYTIASSVNAPTFATVTNLTTDGTYDLYRYDEASFTWQNSKKDIGGGVQQFTAFQNGRGYLYRKAGSEKIKYEGDVNVGDLTYTLMSYASENASVKGFNLIGNPFPHNIYKGYGGAIDESKLSDKFYYLDDNSTWQIGTYLTPIKPGMGIMVQTNSTGAITIKDDNTAATAEKAPAAKSLVNEMMFTIANSQYKDAVYAVFDDGYGLYKLEHQNTEAPMAYITQNNKRYGSAMMSDDVRSFNLNFKAKTISQYTLSCKAFGEFDYVHVIDRLTGEDIDMLLEGEYNFVAAPEDMENRFIVKLGSSADNNENEVFVFQNGNDIVVNGEGELQIFDVTGRMISTQHVSGVETVSKPSQTGVYIFRIVGETVKTQKIVVE